VELVEQVQHILLAVLQSLMLVEAAEPYIKYLVPAEQEVLAVAVLVQVQLAMAQMELLIRVVAQVVALTVVQAVLADLVL
jgi:hypothetical protein